MPRRSKGPRLYLDRKRGQWQIRDGAHYLRTGCATDDIGCAEKLLSEYIAKKYAPPASGQPPLADILLAYMRDRVPTQKSRSAKYNISNLEKFWGGKLLSEVTAANCRAYAATRTQSAARTDLSKLAAAIQHWHQEHGPLDRIPKVVLPPRNPPRTKWMTRSEAARLLWAARRTEHLKRFILIGLHTGSRSGVIKRLKWDWINLDAMTLARRQPGTVEDKTKKTPPIRLPRKLAHFMRRWKRDGVPYVVHYEGQPIKTDPHTAWKTACKRARLTGVSIHTMRHTRATWAMQRGKDLWATAGFLGMTPKVLAETYGHHHPDYQKDAADI